jgi:HEAT repeat protein
MFSAVSVPGSRTLNESRRSQPETDPSPRIDGLIREHLRLLESERWFDLRMAETALRDLGPRAIPALVRTLETGSSQARWCAAKVLGDIADARATEALVAALEDEDGGVRWLAAAALVAIGPSVVVPLLRRLLWRADSPWTQEGVHHVLRSMRTPTLAPVITALEGRFPALAVPVAAHEALKRLEALPGEHPR